MCISLLQYDMIFYKCELFAVIFLIVYMLIGYYIMFTACNNFTCVLCSSVKYYNSRILCYTIVSYDNMTSTRIYVHLNKMKHYMYVQYIVQCSTYPLLMFKSSSLFQFILKRYRSIRYVFTCSLWFQMFILIDTYVGWLYVWCTIYCIKYIIGKHSIILGMK